MDDLDLMDHVTNQALAYLDGFVHHHWNFASPYARVPKARIRQG